MELNLFPELILHAGGRFDYHSTFGHALSPRVALIYSPSSRTVFKYLFGEAFRAPNSYEEFYNDRYFVALPPRTLRPERIVSNEFVLERSVVPWLTVTADGF